MLGQLTPGKIQIKSCIPALSANLVVEVGIAEAVLCTFDNTAGLGAPCQGLAIKIMQRFNSCMLSSGHRLVQKALLCRALLE
jgi:hypothetical protein